MLGAQTPNSLGDEQIHFQTSQQEIHTIAVENAKMLVWIFFYFGGCHPNVQGFLKICTKLGPNASLK